MPSFLNAIVVLSFILNTVLTFLSQTGAYGHTNGELSRKYQSLATPAGYAFAIWGIIFSLEALFAVAQLFPKLSTTDDVVLPAPWFICACLFQAAWSVAFGMEMLILAQVLILLIFASLWRMNVVLQDVARRAPPSWPRYLLCHLPFSIHFGWLTAASAVSCNLSLVAARPHDHAMLLAVAIASLTFVFVPVLCNPASSSETDPGYALTIAWALTGVGVQLRAPLAKAPTADPILDWCPSFVTNALAGVAAALACTATLVTAVRLVARVIESCRRPNRPAAVLADALIVK